MKNEYLDSIKKQFEYYKMLGDKTFSQLQDDKLFWQYNDDSNSIATIVKHLWGKMLAENGWTSLSIPKGNSQSYNKDKFSKPKQRGHFTDEFLKPL